MTFIMLLLLSFASADSPFAPEQVTQLIYSAAVDKNSFPPEISNTRAFRWACGIELEDGRAPKSCFQLLQILEDLEGKVRVRERKILRSLAEKNQKKREIQNYKELRTGGMSGE